MSWGTSFGLLSKYFTSLAANPASAGVLRLAKTDAVEWRNNANGGNLALAINGSDQLTYNGAIIPTGTVVSSITGTAHQVIASASTGAVTLSTPQNIDTSSSPSFASLTVGGINNTGILSQSNATAIEFLDSTNTHFCAIQAPVSISPSNYTLKLPAAQGGTGTVLTNSDGAGTLTWTTPIGTSAGNLTDAGNGWYYCYWRLRCKL